MEPREGLYWSMATEEISSNATVGQLRPHSDLGSKEIRDERE